jgi:iron complex transport system substrate-binding protein
MRLDKHWIWCVCCAVIGMFATEGVAQTKMPLKYATGFEVAYYPTHKVVTVLKPWFNAEKAFTYVLVPKGQKTPDGFDETQRIEIPIKRLITTSTTHLPHLELLDEINHLVGINDIKYVHSPVINKKFEAGQLAQVGHGASVDLEKIVSLETDLVLTSAIAETNYNAHPTLIQAGIPVVVNADYTEPSLLGRTEWIKFMAVFFNKEKQAEALFDDIVQKYNAYSARVKNMPLSKRPTVFGGTLWRGTWFMAGGKTYAAQLIADAGGRYLWAEDDSHQSLSLDFEVVFEKAQGADFWIAMSNDWHTLTDLENTDERYTAFNAFKTGQVFNANARMSARGGNDYWERGLVEPHMLLADLVKIFHPDQLPDYQLKYYKNLKR